MYVCSRNQRTKTAACVCERNCLSGSESAKRQETRKKKKVVSESVEYIRLHITWPAPNARVIFAQDKFKMHRRSWQHMARDYSVQSGFWNYLIYRRPTTFVLGTSGSWILFFKFFLLHGFSLICLKYRSVNLTCSSFSNNRSGDFLYSDTINVRRPTFKSSIPKPTRSYPNEEYQVTSIDYDHPSSSISKSKVGDRSRGWSEGSLFHSYNTEVSGRALFLSLDCSTLPLIRTLYCWVLSKEASSTIFKVFGMMRLGIEPRSPGPLANTLPTRPMGWYHL